MACFDRDERTQTGGDISGRHLQILILPLEVGNHTLTEPLDDAITAAIQMRASHVGFDRVRTGDDKLVRTLVQNFFLERQCDIDIHLTGSQLVVIDILQISHSPFRFDPENLRIRFLGCNPVRDIVIDKLPVLNLLPIFIEHQLHADIGKQIGLLFHQILDMINGKRVDITEFLIDGELNISPVFFGFTLFLSLAYAIFELIFQILTFPG